MQVIQANEFEAKVLREEAPVVLIFGSSTCGPCFAQKKILETLEVQYKERARFYSIDVEGAAQLATSFGVRSVPVTMLFVHGEPQKSMVGLKMLPEVKAAILEVI